jgi:hypothetical protein
MLPPFLGRCLTVERVVCKGIPATRLYNQLNSYLGFFKHPNHYKMLGLLAPIEPKLNIQNRFTEAYLKSMNDSANGSGPQV